MAKNDPNNEKKVNVPALTRQDLNRFFLNQGAQLKNEARELDIREKEVDAGLEFSKNALEAQSKDRKNQRLEKRYSKMITLVFSFSVLVVVIIFLGFCLIQGFQEIAFEIIKIGGTALIAGVSGYYFGNAKGKREAEENVDVYEESD